MRLRTGRDRRRGHGRRDRGGEAADGRFLYVVANGDDAVTTFKRSKDTGRISFQRCISGDTAAGPAGGGGSGACRAMPRIGPDSGISDATYLVLSPDGQDVYVAGAGDAAVTRLAP